MNSVRWVTHRLRRVLLGYLLERSGETGNPVSLDDIGLAHDGYHDYEPSGWLGLRRALHGVEIGRSQTFLDSAAVRAESSPRR